MKRLLAVGLAVASIMPTSALAEIAECKIESFPGRQKSSFTIVIDYSAKQITECYGGSSNIVTKEFSETVIVVDCPMFGGMRSFRIFRDSGAIVVSDATARPEPGGNTHVGQCEIVRPKL